MARVVISRIFDPFINLATETALFKALDPSQHLLFLYINDPCIVIGRNQNPWKEVNLLKSAELNIPVIRRRSGGGTVVHDRGNVNFCVQGPKEEFSRNKHGDMIVDALRKRGANLSVNERHDIINGSGQKVSGSAFKLEREKSYHHATMLLQTNLGKLRQLLHRPATFGEITGLGTKSVPSPVANADIDPQLYIDAWVEAFQNEYGAKDPKFVGPEELTDDILKDAEVFKSWKWSFGDTPRFHHKIGPYQFEVNKGIITEGPPHLVGQEYRNLQGIPNDILMAIDPYSLSHKENAYPDLPKSSSPSSSS